MKLHYLVPIMELDPNWMMRGYPHEFYALEYSKQTLNIPLKYIQDAFLCEQGLKINLNDLENIAEEEWYMKLIRLSKYKSAS